MYTYKNKYMFDCWLFLYVKYVSRTYLSIYLSIYPSTHLLSIYLSIYPSIYLGFQCFGRQGIDVSRRGSCSLESFG